MTRKRSKNTANSNAFTRSDPTNITVVAPPDKYATLRILFETVTVIALLISLSISFMQMRAAMRKEADATEALRLAEAALEMSREAQTLIEQQQRSLADLRELEEVTRERTRIAYLTVRAENGDRAAFNELWALATNDRGELFAPHTPEYKNIQRIMTLYRGDHIGDPFIEMATTSPPVMGLHNQNPVGLLGSAHQESRAHGLNHIRRMRLNEHIPRLIEMIAPEKDLHILQLLGIVLSDLLASVGYDDKLDIYDLAVTTDLTIERLQEYWKNYSNELLNIKPRYWKQVENPPYAPMWVLTDPDAEQPASAKDEGGR